MQRNPLPLNLRQGSEGKGRKKGERREKEGRKNNDATTEGERNAK
jgi:hypothetical protein